MSIIKKNIWLLFYVLLFVNIIFLLIVSYFKYEDIKQKSLVEQKNFVNLVASSAKSFFTTQEMMLDILGKELLRDNKYKHMVKNPHILDYLLSINSAIITFKLATPEGKLTFTSSNVGISNSSNLKAQEFTRDSFNHTLESDKMFLGRTYYFKPAKRLVIPMMKAIRDKHGKVLAVMVAELRAYGGSSIFSNMGFSDKHFFNLVRSFDNYIQIRLPKMDMITVHKKPLPSSLVEFFYSKATSKYKESLEKLKSSEKTLYFEAKNKSGKKTQVIMKYNKRYELWIVSQVKLYDIEKKFYKIVLIYIAIFILFEVLLYLFFKYINDVEKKRTSDLEFQATHDILTSLPNRIYLSKNINNWIYKNAKPFSMLFIDMDNFKNVNDRFGHAFGDKVLVELSKRIRLLIDKNSILIRYGGDEFIVLSHVTDCQELQQLSQSIIKSLSQPYHINNLTFILGASIGIALYPTQEDTLDGLLRASDIAMYEAKKYKNCTYFFADSMRKAYVDNLEMEQELKVALDKNEFYLVYQPQCLQDGTVYGVEALLRWNNTKFQNTPPDKFIPVVENIGMMPKIGCFVMSTALHEIGEIKTILGKKFNLSINISVKQFLETNFLENIKNKIEKEKFDKNYLTLEITESIFIEDMNYILHLLHKVKSMGLNISLDDFGTGYSSLSLLKNLPIDEIKIDKSFVDEMVEKKLARKMVENIITIGKNLDISMLAEGVEKKEQVEIIKSLGCDIFQGYYYSKPLSKEGLIEFLKKNLNQI